MQWYTTVIIIINFISIDINECDQESDSCQQHCNNTIGSYVCYCDDGYQLDEDTFCIGNIMHHYI